MNGGSGVSIGGVRILRAIGGVRILRVYIYILFFFGRLSRSMNKEKKYEKGRFTWNVETYC